MKEYGGYLEWERYSGEEYHNGYRIDSVRSALIFVIRKRKYTHIWIPYYLCDCFQELFKILNISFSYYNIDSKFRPILPDTLPQTNCVLIVNYYGQLLEDDIKYLAQKYHIFLDNTQAFFEKPINGIDMANSCRKFFGVTGGGYLYTLLKIEGKDIPDYDTAYDKAQCLIGRYEENATKFYSSFVQNERIVRGAVCKRMSRFVQNILKSLDYERIIKRRTENYLFLDRALKKYNKLHLAIRKGPFMYPLLIENGGKIKKELIDNKIYIPTLWPGVEKFDELNEFERDLINNLVLLPIDQRYNEKDMQYISHVLLKISGGGVRK